MELTLDSAFSTGGMVGHLSYIFMVVSMLMRKINYLRVLVAASAVTAICYDWFWLRDPVGVFWETLLLLVSLAMLAIEYWKNLKAKFNTEETIFVAECLSGLSPSHARKLLDAGSWINEEKGMILVREGVPADHLYFIADGIVDIHIKGKSITKCGQGNFVGEMSVLENHPAIASASVEKTVRLWTVRKSALRQIVDQNEEIASALEVSFSNNYRQKFKNINEALLHRDAKK